MTGHAAIITFDEKATKEPLEAMLKWVRPPFALTSSPQELHLFQNIAIGGLSVTCDETKSVWLVFSGQLFTPTDILNRYLEVGESAFNELDGEFSFLLLDERKKELYALRDRLGIYPLYWHINSKYAYIATSLKAILATGRVSPTPDLAGIASALSLGFISQDTTCIEEVNRLLPGYYLKLSLSGTYKICPYWSFSSTFTKEYSVRFDSSIEIYCEIERQLQSAIQKRATKNGSVVSGKLGSLLISDFLHEATTLDATPTPQDFLSSLIPMIWAMEMPNAECSASESWKFAELAKATSRTAYFDTGVSTEFYDFSSDALEVFQTHYKVPRYTGPSVWSKLGFFLTPRMHLETLRKREVPTPLIGFMENKLLLPPNEFISLAPELSRYFDVNLFVHQFYHLQRIPKLDAGLFYLTIKSFVSDGLSESRLRIAQSHGLQAQSPFLDYKLLEFFASIAPEAWASPDLIARFLDFWKQNHEVSEEMGAWPIAPPVNEKLFLSKEVWPLFVALRKGVLVEMGLVSSSWIKKALKEPKPYLKVLYALLILEIWFRLFIDRPLLEANKELTLQELYPT